MAKDGVLPEWTSYFKKKKKKKRGFLNYIILNKVQLQNLECDDSHIILNFNSCNFQFPLLVSNQIDWWLIYLINVKCSVLNHVYSLFQNDWYPLESSKRIISFFEPHSKKIWKTTIFFCKFFSKETSPEEKKYENNILEQPYSEGQVPLKQSFLFLA